jgi:leader peptidase (prepilin peptidase)/N-methyltransferase
MISSHEHPAGIDMNTMDTAASRVVAGALLAPCPVWLVRVHSTSTELRRGGLPVYAGAILSGGLVGVWPVPVALAAAPLLVFGVALAAIDIREHRLPNRLTMMFSGSAVATFGVAACWTGHLATWLQAVGVGMLYSAFLLIWYLISPTIGPGDPLPRSTISPVRAVMAMSSTPSAAHSSTRAPV